MDHMVKKSSPSNGLNAIFDQALQIWKLIVDIVRKGLRSGMAQQKYTNHGVIPSRWSSHYIFNYIYCWIKYIYIQKFAKSHIPSSVEIHWSIQYEVEQLVVQMVLDMIERL